MGSEYPDVPGDLVDARKRFEVNGVHYVAALHPDTIAPGETTNLHAWLQSCWDVPVDVAISVHLPSTPASSFSTIQKRTDIPLEAGEVGLVMIPIACATQTEPGAHKVSMLIGAKYQTRGLYVRSQESKGLLGDTLLTFDTGMSLASSVGLGFTARTRPECTFRLQVEGQPKTTTSPDLTPTFVSHWTVTDLAIQGKARTHINDQRLQLLPRLSRQSLYRAFLDESQARYQDATLPLQIGEAIFLAKILTYTVEYFLKQPNGQDGILVPAYILAYRHDLPTDDPVFLIVRADYPRITRLAISLSFGMLRRQIGVEPWTREEQLALADLVANRVERGGTLPAEFLYLPLVLGGLMVASGMQMPGENVAQSLGLLVTARDRRTTELAENPELNHLLDQLLQLARQRS